MPSPSFGGGSHTKREPIPLLQPVRIARLKWAGEPWNEERPIDEFEYPEDLPAYVKDQVIVAGRENDVKTIVSEALRNTETLRDPIYLERLLPPDALERFPDQGQGPVIIDLYHTGGMTVREVVASIRERAARAGLAVFVDPNYVTGHPHIPVGSPHIPVGSGLDGVAEAKGKFWEQWAFEEQGGIGLTAEGQRSNSLNYTGEGIRVAVFDTSPFPDPGSWEIDWITPSLELNVTHLLARAEARESPTADHGLFVAGLVHAVAPDSQIELIQVLNEEAVGDLDTLNYALFEFGLQRLLDTGTLDNTVMNLSLGFPVPSTQAGLDLDLVYFKALLDGAASLGATVVAAAGNASSTLTVEPAEVPATYSSVIGVAASRRDKTRSCFSNEGDVAAPGGDTYEPSTGQCVDRLVIDKKTKEARGAVIGPTLHTAPDSGYAYWVGTSFSAPLVSGLAALMLERQVAGPLFGSVRVKHPAPPLGSPLGKGIIDVPNSVT